MNSDSQVSSSTMIGDERNESPQSAVSWGAIFCGALAAIAVTLILATLGAGLNLMSISPWANTGVTATTFTIATGIGLIVVQWLASAIGGYLTGRLRTRRVGIHTHEVFFRDTAHGFMAWAVATAVGVIFFASAASSIIGGGVHAVATISGGAAQGAGQAVAQATSSVSAYDVESLFRSDRPDAGANPQAVNGEVSNILANGLANGDLSADDRSYLAQLIATRTGISRDDAQKRVDDVVSRAKAAAVKAKQAADAARKVASQVATFTALSMLIGAFIAATAAAYGGGLRDDHYSTDRRA